MMTIPLPRLIYDKKKKREIVVRKGKTEKKRICVAIYVYHKFICRVRAGQMCQPKSKRN